MSLFSMMPSLHAIKISERNVLEETTLAMSFVLKADYLLFCEHDVFTMISHQQFFQVNQQDKYHVSDVCHVGSYYIVHLPPPMPELVYSEQHGVCMGCQSWRAGLAQHFKILPVFPVLDVIRIYHPHSW